MVSHITSAMFTHLRSVGIIVQLQWKKKARQKKWAFGKITCGWYRRSVSLQSAIPVSTGQGATQFQPTSVDKDKLVNT